MNRRKNTVKRLKSVWSWVDKNQTKAKPYRECMEEYGYLWHVKELNIENSKDMSYFVPHHIPYTPENTLSIAFSIFFKSRASTTSEHSFNSIILNGGIVQKCIFLLYLDSENIDMF